MHISIAIKLNIFLYLYSAATDNYEYLQWIQIYQIPWRKGRHNELWLIPGTAYWISALAGVEVKGKGLENDLVWREGRHCWGASGTLSSVIERHWLSLYRNRRPLTTGMKTGDGFFVQVSLNVSSERLLCIVPALSTYSYYRSTHTLTENITPASALRLNSHSF